MKKESLRGKIRRFNRKKIWAAPPLILAGLAGVILPVIPGWPLVAAGISLITPRPRNFTKRAK